MSLQGKSLRHLNDMDDIRCTRKQSRIREIRNLQNKAAQLRINSDNGIRQEESKQISHQIIQTSLNSAHLYTEAFLQFG